MQRGRRTTLTVTLPDLDISTVQSVSFLYKQYKSETAKVKKEERYPGNVTYSAAHGCFLIPWSISDTYLFQEGPFYMDILVTRNDSEDMDEIDVVELTMNGTLRKEGE